MRCTATILVALLLGTLCARAEDEGAVQPQLRLEDLERMALATNPTIAQTAAAIRAVQGQWIQAGAKPNPVVGYVGGELSIFRDKWKVQTAHVFFIEQQILRGHKLRRAQQVLEYDQAVAEADAEAQRHRVLTAVRVLYYDTLAAERLVEVRLDLARLAHEAVEFSEQLVKIGEADPPDVLQAEIEAQRAEIDAKGAEQRRRRTRQVFAAVVGDPSVEHAALEGDIEVASLPTLEPAKTIFAAFVGEPSVERAILEGNIEGGLPTLKPAENTIARFVRESPELKAAQARILGAQAAIEQARSDSKGDITVRAGFGYNFERAHGNGGWIGEFEIGMPISLFDKKHGAIAAAQEQARIAELEAKWLERSLHARFAAAFQRYVTARDRADAIRVAIVPRAEKAYRFYLNRFHEITAASYPQMLAAQRTLFQARAQHVEALAEAWHESTLIQGFLLSGELIGLEAMPAVEALPTTLGMN